MTKKQQLFCEEYLIDLNATQAAIRAGYKPESAGSVGSENLKKPEIRARIDKAMAERSKRTGVNADRVVRELARVAFVNASDVIDMNKATVIDGACADDTAAISSVKVKNIPTDDGEIVEREIRLADKLKALKGEHSPATVYRRRPGTRNRAAKKNRDLCGIRIKQLIMEKELFIALCDQLKNKVPELRWIDSDQGQLNVSERPPVAFPCCLVEMSYPQCTTHMAGKQRVRVRFQLQVAFNVWGTANASAPQESREKALQQYDTLQNIHKALQWWSFGRKINPTSRVSVLTENRSNGLKIFRMIYESEFMD